MNLDEIMAFETGRALAKINKLEEDLILSCLPKWIRNKPIIFQRIYVKIVGLRLCIKKEYPKHKFWIEKRKKRITDIEVFDFGSLTTNKQ